jgi:hypothetical protein
MTGSTSSTKADIAVTNHKDANGTSWLYQTNVTMKQIDLASRIVAPALAGMTMGMMEQANHHNHLATTALLIGLLNAMALMVEYTCTLMIYQLVPTLANKRRASPIVMSRVVAATTNTATTTICHFGGYGQDQRHVPTGLRIYLSQPISSAGISLSLL